MGEILSLSRNDAFIMLGLLCDELFTSSDLRVINNPDLSISLAGVFGNDHATIVEIGVRELASVKDKRHVHVSDEVFATIVLNMYHEKAYCIQKNELFRQIHLDPYTANQLIQEIACMNNPDYYFDHNHAINASEIQAEQYGVMSTYQYLCSRFPEVDVKDHERIVLNIVNYKMFNSTYFISSSEPFTSLSEVEKAFDDAYNSFFTKKRTYMVNSSSTIDDAKLFMRKHPESKEAYLNADSPLEQDRCIAAINLKLHPEWIEAYPVLSDMNLL